MKNKLMGILALASCVVLSGCNKENGEVKITIADLPTDLVAGDKIDLNEYITVSGGQGDYSLNFDDESYSKISIDNKTELTLNEFGSVKFTVDYSGKSLEGTINVGSVLLNDFLKDTKDVGYDYATLSYDDYGYVESWSNYGEKFFVNMFYEQVSEEDYLPGGFLEGPDEKVYSFYVDEEGEFVFGISGEEPEEISMYSQKLSLPTSGYEVYSEEYKGEKYEVLRFEENEAGDVAKLFSDFFWIDLEVLDEYKLDVAAFEVTDDELLFDDGSAMAMYDLYAMCLDNDKSSETYGEEVPVAITSLSIDKEFFFKDEVQAYIDSGEQPASKYSLNLEKIDEAIKGHNYQIDYSYNWYDCEVNEDGTDLIRTDVLGENPFVDEKDFDKEGSYIHDFFNAIGGFSAYVSSDKVFVDVPNGTKYGLIEKSDVAWDYAYKTDKYVATENLGRKLFSSQVNAKMYNFEFLSGIEIDEEIGSVYDGMFINYKDEISESTTKYTLTGASCSFLFEALFLDSIYDGDTPKDYVIGNYTTVDIVALFMLEQGMNNYLQVEITEKYDGEDLDELIFDFIWIDYEEPASYYDDYTYYEYVMSADIKFGVCDMPAFDVEFPAAE